jgi:hypothetical protein
VYLLRYTDTSGVSQVYCPSSKYSAPILNQRYNCDSSLACSCSSSSSKYWCSGIFLTVEARYWSWALSECWQCHSSSIEYTTDQWIPTRWVVSIQTTWWTEWQWNIRWYLCVKTSFLQYQTWFDFSMIRIAHSSFKQPLNGALIKRAVRDYCEPPGS